jgi:class 3 adenylate cyclase
MWQWRLSIRWLLTALLAFISLGLGLSIIALSFNFTKAASLRAGSQLMEVTGAAINDSFAKFRLEITAALATSTGSRLAAAQTFAARADAREDLIPMLLVNKLVATARIGFPDGDSFALRRLSPSDRIPDSWRAKGVYIILGDRYIPGGAESHYWLYDGNMRMLTAGLLPRTYFDPRTRPWFKARTDRATFSIPYVSLATQTNVFSLSQKSRAGSVLDIDVELDGYSERLRQLRPTPSTVGAIIRTTSNVVLAFTDIGAFDARIQQNGDRPVTLEQLRSGPLLAVLAIAAPFTEPRETTYRDGNGRTWLCSFTPSRDANGNFLSRAVVLAVPEDELLAAVLRELKVALTLCLIIVLCMIPIAYLLAKIIAEPLDALRRDALTLRNLDFSPQPPRRSVIAELDEFARTFGTMRQHVKEHNDAVARFIPSAFLNQLGQRDIVGLRLGDHREALMTLMFADIREFTTLSGGMSPSDTFAFVNSYLSEVGPIVRTHGGFIDKYIGDAIFAIFPDRPSDAVSAAISMQRRLAEYNQGRVSTHREPVRIGVGIHRGPLMLGTIGETERFETTVISDAVNVAARLEGLTKVFGSLILATDEVVREIERSKYCLRDLGKILVKGGTHPVTVYEVCDADPDDVRAYKVQTVERFEEGRASYFRGDFSGSGGIFAEVARNGYDRAAAYYRDRATLMASANGAMEWDGVEHMENK